MQMTYSHEADALMVVLARGVEVDRGVVIAPGVVADFDAAGRLLSVEILNASAHYDQGELDHLPSPVEWLDVSAAAQEFGLPEAGIRKELEAGRLTGRRVGNDWQVARHVMLNLLEELEEHSMIDDTSIANPPGYLSDRRDDTSTN